MISNMETIKPGMILYDNHRTRMGNTNLSRIGEWPVRIIEVGEDSIGFWAKVSWNHNRPTTYREHQLRRLYATSMSEREKKKKLCPVCSARVSVRKNGTLVKHDMYGRRVGPGWACSGSGREP